MGGCATGIVSSVEVPTPTDECACVGIKSIVWNSNNTVTITLTDNSSITSPNLKGVAGLNGLNGLSGTNGTNGINGKDVEMRYDSVSGYVQYRLVGASIWLNLYQPFLYPNENWVKFGSGQLLSDGSTIPDLRPPFMNANAPFGFTGSLAYKQDETNQGLLIRKKYDKSIELRGSFQVDTSVFSTNNMLLTPLPAAYRPTTQVFINCSAVFMNNSAVLDRKVILMLIESNGEIPVELKYNNYTYPQGTNRIGIYVNDSWEID